MTKIQIIIDDGESLKALTCTGIEAQRFEPDYPAMYGYGFSENIQKFNFTANTIIVDDSSTLISLPNELLLRIRDYNIDTEHQHAIKQTLELKEKMVSLKDQVRGWELRRDLAMEEYGKYQKAIVKMIDRYPMAAAEIALEDGNLDAACYFAKKAYEEEEE